MAPMGRRRRRDISDDGAEEVEVESASSSFRQNQNKYKRTKVALAQAAGGSTVSDDEDDMVDGYDDLLNDGWDDGGRESSPLDADAEHSLLIEHSDLETEEMEGVPEMIATQIMEKHLKKTSDNVAQEAGVIDEIYMRNFMCHSKLRFKMGPLINFVIGHNGSGKSAVLTALTMCLGGKAREANRGTNLKSMIKTGEESCTLWVTIKNKGEAAYKRELFGDVVKVERHFSRAGTSGFRIKNEQDKTISTKKSDLDDILDFFCLQLDNPINVLSQDNARSFLSNSSSADKYKFFIKGTGLETLHADYQLMEENIDETQEKLRTRHGDIEGLRKKYEEAERRKKNGERTDKMHVRVKECMRQHAWRQIEDKEAEVAGAEQGVASGQEAVREAEEKAEEASNALEAHENAKSAAERGLEELQSQLQPISDHHEAEKEKFEKNKKELLDLKAEQRNMKESIKKCKADKKRLGDDILEEKKRLEEVNGDAHTRRLDTLKELEEAAEKAKDKLEQHNANFAGLKATVVEAEKNLKPAQAAKRKAEEEAQSAQNRLNGLQREQNNIYGAYHNKMESLVREVDRETRWRQKPVGPLGVHVRNTKPEWGPILEKTFGHVLSSFVVTCKDDQLFLNSIAKRIGIPNLTIYIGNPAPLPIAGKEPEEGVDTILRVLRIDNDLVQNTLMINQAIEQVVLIKNSADAVKYQEKNPTNVKAILAFVDKGEGGLRYDWSRSHQSRSSHIEEWKGQLRMKTDRSEALRLQAERSNEAKRSVEQAAEVLREAQQDLHRAKQAEEKHRRATVSVRTAMQDAEDAVEAQKADIDNNRPQDGKLQELERQLQETIDEQATAEGSFSDSVTQVDALNDKARELKNSLDSAYQELTAKKAQIDQAEVRVQRREAQRYASLLEKNAVLDNVETQKNYLERLEAKRDKLQKELEEWTALATTVSERVATEPGVTLAMYEERLDRLKREHERMQRNAGGSLEDLTRAYATAASEYFEAKKELDELQKLKEQLKKSLDERYRRWGLFRKYISMRARIQFHYLLSERQFRGNLKLNHERKLLELSVEPDKTRASDAGRQAKTLSGGEKSFSQICLLLSIWEAMGSPIRCLDEFDVFMDSVNRAQSMNLMIQAARRAVGRQFILITPQAMNNVTLGDDVKIHKMSDPERGQGILTFNGAEMGA